MSTGPLCGDWGLGWAGWTGLWIGLGLGCQAEAWSKLVVAHLYSLTGEAYDDADADGDDVG